MNLIDIFSTLPISTNENVFETKRITESCNHRLARTLEGYPVVLIYTVRTGREKRKFNLQNLKIFQEVSCQIMSEGLIHVQPFTILMLTSASVDLQHYFLKISEIFIESLPLEPDEEQVLAVIFKYIEIFKLLTGKAHKPALGLWAELFIIANAANPASMINCWHSNPLDKYDFYLDTERIEVKATTQCERIHTFALDQLNPPEGVTVRVASLMTKIDALGLGILDLVEVIKQNLNEDETIEKMLYQISLTLGDSFEEAVQIKFNEDSARSSLKYFDTVQIPKILTAHVPYKVSNVKFQVHLE